MSQETAKVVGDLATVDLVALRPTDQVSRARELLYTVGIHALPVLDGDDAVGIVTSTDLIDDGPDSTNVTAVMTPAPTSIGQDVSLQEAAKLMVSDRVHHLLVHDAGKIIGILSSFDLLDALAALPAD